ncbi:MAG: branched-chain amino acid transaminase [Thermodesulfobacteriota bacterium]|nr:branched-chain amino acid transaminase [Thermodesulfobacteriota bacterium]
MKVVKLSKIWMDGQLLDWDDANVHVLTHTLHYGVGVFEGIRSYRCSDGKSAIFKLEEHVKRLFESAHIAMIPVSYTEDQIADAIIETLKANNLREGYIRPLIYIGDGEMGLYVEDYPVRVSIAVWEWGAYLGEEGLKNGIRAKVSSFTRLNVNINMTKAKICGNYVNSILAKKEVKKNGYDEAIMLDSEGYVSEASGENIFIVKNNVIKTPPLTSILCGITRNVVLTLAHDLGKTRIEERFTRDELYTADEAFLTGTAAEITPIREVDDRTIGNGKPGPITKELQKRFFETIKGENERYKNWLTYYM